MIDLKTVNNSFKFIFYQIISGLDIMIKNLRLIPSKMLYLLLNSCYIHCYPAHL